MAESSSVDSDLRAKAASFGQQHLFAFWDALDTEQRDRLIGETIRINFPLVEQLYRQGADTDDWSKLARQAQPPTSIRLGHQASLEKARRAGEQALERGQVGAILVAGGEGTRLGFNKPKGMFPVGPISHASLFQIFFEKFIAVGRKHGASVPLYVMTGYNTHAPTEDYLRENNFFGLPPADVRLFMQGVMPAVDAATGRVLLADKGRIALSPDGHGGVLEALARSGALADIRHRGLKHLFYFQVDNPLVQVCDPALIGHHILARSEMTTLAVAKADAVERLGNLVQIDGRTRIIEYSDFPDDVADQRNADGSLRFWAGSIAVHVFDVEFLARAAANASALPYHVARKSVPFIDDRGNPVAPSKPNAVKFERFVFDLLPLAERTAVVEGDRADTFAPLKNAPGEARDTLATCQAAMIALHSRWLQSAGATVAPGVAVEISPLFALDEVELRDKIKPGLSIDRPTYFH